jgi:hypothetical protein
MRKIAVVLAVATVALVSATASSALIAPPQCDGLVQAAGNSPDLDFSGMAAGSEILTHDASFARPLQLLALDGCSGAPGADGFVRVDGNRLGLEPPRADPGTGEAITIKICVETKKLSLWIEIIWDL